MSEDSRQVPSSQVAKDHPLAQLLDDYMPGASLERGQIVRGVVVRSDAEAIIVDVGTKCEGIVSGREMEQLDPQVLERLQPGEKVMVYVVSPEGPCGEVVLSLARAQMETDWEVAQSHLDEQKIVELEVAAANRGGLIAYLGRLRGFIPASQLSPSRSIPRMSDTACSDALDQLIGVRLRVRVIEADRERNRLILSERAAEAQRERQDRAQILDSLDEGDVRCGRVSNLTDFGAFVDLGGIDGLVHLSEISWERVDHPSEVLQVGQDVKVTVLSVDRERQRVALSIKRLEPDPWATVAERYQVGQLIDCRITRLTKWGAFACIVDDEAIEGLVHVSELGDQRVDHPQEVVSPGQVLTLRVLRMEPERHRLALSLRQAAAEDAVLVDGMGEDAPLPPQPSTMEEAPASSLEDGLRA